MDLILSDVTMPHMSGAEMIERIPEVAWIAALPGRGDRRFPALSKPFTFEKFMLAVRECLARRAASAAAY